MQTVDPPTQENTDSAISPSPAYGDDVQIIQYNDRTIIIVGTAHISQESVDLVKKVIEQERPDCVCLELDDRLLPNRNSGRRLI